ncbi:MAG TPA: FlgD immunoglobulin-like domain containing protein [Fibrobacteria bacterium]|nr:FlgD immunoglobulin-like domain containing protein [Fibrobacteria bacterium]
MKKSLLTSMSARIALLGTLALAVGTAMAAGKVGEMAYEFTGLKDFANKAYNLKDFQGKVVLLTTVQYNCGGCQKNAPKIGTIAKEFQGKKFQAMGADIANGNPNQLQYFSGLLKGNDSSLNFPILSGLTMPKDIKDSSLNNKSMGTVWIPYNALRDVYFVIDYTGKIVFRLDGNRSDPVSTDKYASLTNAITTAIANIPTVSIATGTNDQGLCLQACKQGGAYLFNLGSGIKRPVGNVSLNIMDTQGRLIRILNLNASTTGSSGQAIWDGKDSKGGSVAWGNYFVNATVVGQSVTMMLSLIP